jgi:hypothetical protein
MIKKKFVFLTVGLCAQNFSCGPRFLAEGSEYRPTAFEEIARTQRLCSYRAGCLSVLEELSSRSSTPAPGSENSPTSPKKEVASFLKKD